MLSGPRLCSSLEADRCFGDTLKRPFIYSFRTRLMGGNPHPLCTRLNPDLSRTRRWMCFYPTGRLHSSRSVVPTHKLMVLCHFVPIRAKLPAKLYLNMGLVDRTSHTGQKSTVPPLDSCRVRPRVDSHDVRCWDPWCQEVLPLYAACLLPTGGLS